MGERGRKVSEKKKRKKKRVIRAQQNGVSFSYFNVEFAGRREKGFFGEDTKGKGRSGEGPARFFSLVQRKREKKKKEKVCRERKGGGGKRGAWPRGIVRIEKWALEKNFGGVEGRAGNRICPNAILNPASKKKKKGREEKEPVCFFRPHDLHARREKKNGKKGRGGGRGRKGVCGKLLIFGGPDKERGGKNLKRKGGRE